MFQFTLPRGERLAAASPRRDRPKFQFTLPRGERRNAFLANQFNGVVSIHAPAWGATLGGLFDGGRVDVSIHAPAWGATAQTESAKAFALVSIHAPAWGATFR